jgi:hypothetical protein
VCIFSHSLRGTHEPSWPPAMTNIYTLNHSLLLFLSNLSGIPNLGLRIIFYFPLLCFCVLNTSMLASTFLLWAICFSSMAFVLLSDQTISIASGFRFMNKVPVAHTCNPSYSVGRDQEDNGSKPARANSS